MMSDPAGKGEIEDVIASIRRLVRSAPNAHRLVLTDALRVDAAPTDGEDAQPADDRGSDGQGDPADADAPFDQGAADTAVSLEKALAELEAELAVDAAMGSREDRYDPWEPVDTAPREAVPEEPAEIELEVASAAEAEVVMFSRTAATGRTPGADDAEPAALAADDAPAAAEMTEAADDTADAMPGAFAPVEDGVAQQAAPVYRPVAPDPPPHAPAENVAAPDPESLLDENELRALVAEVLREELKGPLGERITRNVRKLVRREIAQALSNYDIG
jgi:hypothetical protein